MFGRPKFCTVNQIPSAPAVPARISDAELKAACRSRRHKVVCSGAHVLPNLFSAAGVSRSTLPF